MAAFSQQASPASSTDNSHGDTATVHVTRAIIVPGSSGLVKAMPAESQEEQLKLMLSDANTAFDKAQIIIVKLGRSYSWKPWYAAKNKTRAETGLALLETQRSGLMKMLSTSVEKSSKLEKENVLAMQSVSAHADLVIDHNRQAALIANLRSEIDHLSKSKLEGASVTRELLNKVEEVIPGPKRYLKVDDARESELLQGRLAQLLEEHENLRTEADGLGKVNTGLSARVKELNLKVKDEVDLREREMRRLTFELSKARDFAATSTTAAKAEVTAELARRGQEAKSQQRRLETAKVELDAAKMLIHAMKQQSDETAAVLGKASEDTKNAGRRMALLQASRDEGVAALEAARSEKALFAAQYQQTVAALVAVSGRGAVPGAASLSGDSTRPWPRQAFTMKGSCVLHSHSCVRVGGNQVEPKEYQSADELMAWLAEGRLVLCSACKGPSF